MVLAPAWRCRKMICLTWVQRPLCQRSVECELTQQQRETLKDALHSGCAKNMIKRCWVWYDALMFTREDEFWVLHSDSSYFEGTAGVACTHEKHQPLSSSCPKRSSEHELMKFNHAAPAPSIPAAGLPSRRSQELAAREYLTHGNCPVKQALFWKWSRVAPPMASCQKSSSSTGSTVAVAAVIDSRIISNSR